MWAKVKDAARVWFKQLLCRHEPKILHSDLYQLTGTNNPKKGTVVISTAQCLHCKKFFVWPSDLQIQDKTQNS